ncbi:hypothetical protein [Nonomuraea sp. NPDC049504]|uniref:hypothetical protein n=1 Tax=Nonomuraea sp. NPDC049504 TaxID=3154729 RepID=UPI0034399779
MRIHGNSRRRSSDAGPVDSTTPDGVRLLDPPAVERLGATLSARTIAALSARTIAALARSSPIWPRCRAAPAGSCCRQSPSPGMVVDANELSVRHHTPAISRHAGSKTSETLRIRSTGRMRHGRSTSAGRRHRPYVAWRQATCLSAGSSWACPPLVPR